MAYKFYIVYVAGSSYNFLQATISPKQPCYPEEWRKECFLCLAIVIVISHNYNKRKLITTLNINMRGGVGLIPEKI